MAAMVGKVGRSASEHTRRLCRAVMPSRQFYLPHSVFILFTFTHLSIFPSTLADSPGHSCGGRDNPILFLPIEGYEMNSPH